MRIKVRYIDSLLIECSEVIHFCLKDVPLNVQEQYLTYIAYEEVEKAYELASAYCFLDQYAKIEKWRKNGKRYYKKHRRKN